MLFRSSRDLTVTNKILQYLLAGLAVVASDTSGQREVAARAPGAVRVYPSGDSRSLALAVDGLLSSRETLGRGKAAALEAARRTYCWEQNAEALTQSVRNAVTA